MLENVLYEKKGAVATVTVNRPKVLNALNTPTWADLRTAFEDARDDATVRGVIVTGAGDKAFIAGADSESSRLRPRWTPNGRVASARRSLR
jgi:enoyl-CoA hydratase/carnithine racemase